MMLSKRTLTRFSVLMGVLVLSVAVTSAQGFGNNGGRGRDGNQPNNAQSNAQNSVQMNNRHQANGGYGIIATDIELPVEVIEALTVTLLDEYSAQDAYSQVIANFGDVIPFVNLRDAEGNHASVLERVFTRYGLTIPEPASVNIPDFETVEQACSWAYQLEVDNAGLYADYLELVADYPDIERVMTHLSNASQYNHMTALAVCTDQ